MTEVVWPQIEERLGMKREALDAEVRSAMNDTFTSTVARSLKEKICRRIAKEMGSGVDYVQVNPDLTETHPLEGQFVHHGLSCPIKGRFKITKAEFDEVMEHFLQDPLGQSESAGNDRSLIAPIHECIQSAGLSPEDLDVLVLHGGSCRNPSVRAHFERVLHSPNGPFSKAVMKQTPDLDTSVACGAALACYWKHVRGVELIQPITAEDVGIMTLGDRPVCLVTSGTKLPFPEAGVHAHADDFYVPKNGQTELIVPFYAGPTDRNPRYSGSVKIKLPPGVRRGDVVRLRLSVDRNKILHWWYQVGEGDFQKAQPLEDPWTPRQLSPADRRLLAHRHRMSAELRDQGLVPDWMLLREAALLHSAGRLDEAEVALRDLVGERGCSSTAMNLLALICGEQGNSKDEEFYAERAASQAPDNAIMAGNYGCTLVKNGKVGEGIARIRAALALNPELAYLYEWLGDAYRELGDEQSALREYRQNIKLLERTVVGESGSPRVWSDLARTLQKVGEYERASEARAKAHDARLNELYDGDHRERIAGPDSGFWVEEPKGLV